MKILALRGKNLASLAGEFDVDFEQEPLKSAGLFAISGPTGAGKSTLLDALCMALYENTPRLIKAGGNKTLPDGKELISQQDTGNLLRRGTGEGYAEVDFVGNDGLQYRARWSVRRSRNKANGSLQPTSMTLHQLPELLPIGGKKTEVKAEIEKRIGLKFEQFTRAVLLAQNEFSSFLKADDNERGELLETLTGSLIYSDLSRRAYQRAKEEHAALERFHTRLADNKPLSADERSELDSKIKSTSEQVHTLDAQLAAVETHLRWHQDAEKLAHSEQAAQQTLQQREQEQAASSSRRLALQQLDAVQTARPLLTEITRLHSVAVQDQVQISAAQNRLTQASEANHHAITALENAHLQLQAREQEQIAAAEQLDQAKALDASIATMLPTHQQVHETKTKADATLTRLTEELAAQQNQFSHAQKRRNNAALWLQQHVPLQNLAEQWPAWDVLFKQAANTRSEMERYQQQLTTLDLNDAQQSLSTQNATLKAAQESLAATEQQRQLSTQVLSEFDRNAHQKAREQAEQRREHLSSATQLLRTLSEQNDRANALQTQHKASQQVAQQADAAVQQAQAALPAASAAMQQAERALKSAEAACSANVEDLRAQLQDDTACPVCGATEHPYFKDKVGTNPQLHQLLLELQQQMQSCRQQDMALRETISQQSAIAKQQHQQSAQYAQQLQHSAEQLAQQQILWQTHCLFVSDVDYPVALRNLQQQHEQLAAQIRQLQQNDARYQQALQAKDTAQAAYDKAQQQALRSAESQQAALTALSTIQNERERLAGLIQQAQTRLHDTLNELEPAFKPAKFGTRNNALPFKGTAWEGMGSGEAINDLHVEDNTLQDSWREDWKDSWQLSPAAFHHDCAQQVQQWQSQLHSYQQADQELASLHITLANAQAVQQQALAEQQRLQIECDNSTQALQAKQAQRRAIFNGEAISQITARFAAAIEHAKAQKTRHADLASNTQQTLSRTSEALAQAQARCVQYQQDALAAQMQLEQWLANFNSGAANLPDQMRDDVLDIHKLTQLLSHSNEWISAERAALQAIANATQHAATILQERRQQCIAHQAQQPAAVPPDETLPASGTADSEDDSAKDNLSAKPADDQPDAKDALQNRWQTLKQQRQQAQQQLSQHQLAHAQDQARRTQAAGLLQEMQTQEIRHRIWAQLNDLIGSESGKKFRNYAQQYTLDVLLAYANQHLHQLARRYRLQRIDDTLALMVIDQDMGDENRSVHSLSGGESFLVSLALALGLASLSSNRVKVESLFIDEGFGSLDADTLRVAMDALDSLQAQGRKVGVISHVQEMTERIATKIMVQRTAGGRSLVGY